MAATNLNSYYSSIGQALPSLSTRGGLYASNGLGDAASYVGSAAQNASLLGALTKTGATPSTSGAGSSGIFASTPTSTGTPVTATSNAAPSSDPYAAAENQPSISDFYTNELNTLGVPDLQKTVQTFKDQTSQVNDQLNNLTADINARTTGTLTSQAQADRMNTVEGGVLRNQLAKLGTSAQPATDALSNALDTAKTMAGFFTTDQQNQMSVIMDKIKRGQALTDQETTQANDLAKIAAQAKATAAANPPLDLNSFFQWLQQNGYGGSGTGGGSTAPSLDSLFPTLQGGGNTNQNTISVQP